MPDDWANLLDVISESVEHSQPQFAHANGLQLCYDTFGRPADPAILLVMGLATQMILWEDDFCRELASRGFYVVRFDNRDIGLSTKLSGAHTPGLLELMFSRVGKAFVKPAYTLRDMARDAFGLMDALGIAKAHVVGASMGGMIVQEMATLAPERLRSLTSIMSTTGDSKLPGPTRAATAALFRKPTRDREEFLERYVAAWRVYNGGRVPFDEAQMRRLGELTFSRGLNPAGALRQMQAIAASGNRKPSLRRVRVPTLVIHGDADPLVPISGGRATARAIPKAKLVVIAGMGHLMSRRFWPQIVGEIAAHAASSDR